MTELAGVFVTENSISLSTPDGNRQTVILPSHWNTFIVKMGESHGQLLFRFACPDNTLFVWDSVSGDFEYEMIDAENL